MSTETRTHYFSSANLGGTDCAPVNAQYSASNAWKQCSGVATLGAASYSAESGLWGTRDIYASAGTMSDVAQRVRNQTSPLCSRRVDRIVKTILDSALKTWSSYGLLKDTGGCYVQGSSNPDGRQDARVYQRVGLRMHLGPNYH